ncbi:putative metallocarboxypeptidase ecm14 [Recurvomyces mirabilis]|nr:putative metallocarboxypeptidase ecm14 [Recurvomyces mirabilis]
MLLNTAMLALPAALLISIVAAIPSPAAYVEQRPFSAPAPPTRSRWRTLSNKLIDTVFGDPHDQTRPDRILRGNKQAPPHTFARYGSDIVLRFNVSTAEEAKSLAEAADTLILDVWEYAEDWVDIRLNKDIVAPLLGLLPASLQHSHTPLLGQRDLVQAIFDTYPSPKGQSDQSIHTTNRAPSPVFGSSLKPSREGESNIFFADYQPLSVIDPWMRLLASLFTTHVRKVTIGVSGQGRDIVGLRVGVHPTNNDEPSPKRKTVLVVGGSHAREWIGTASVNFVAYSLITGYGKIPSITHMLEDFDFVFVPSLNPDGYAYTWNTDRLWRKNRQSTNFRFCQGIDIDRAFGYQWDGDVTTTGNPCSESFAGEQPFAATEAKRLADWAKNETKNNNVEFVGFLDLHSYSQQILYPYSYSCDATPPGLENLEELAFGLAKAIRISGGHSYEVMPACEGNVASSAKAADGKQRLWPRMEAAGGSALDWFYHEMKVRYAYQIKLRDRGTYGFLLPRENIVPTGKEVLEAVLYFGNFLGEVYGAAGATKGRVELRPVVDDTEQMVGKVESEVEASTELKVEDVYEDDDSFGPEDMQ